MTRRIRGGKPTEDVLRQCEERFRLLVEGMRDYAIFLLDPTGRVSSWNLGAERIKGYAAEEIIGQHFSRFYPREMVEAGWPRRALQHAKDEGRFEDEGWRVRSDGSQFWANVVITALRDETGHLKGFSKITRDLTERRLAEEALRVSEARLRRAAEATGFGTYDFDVRQRHLDWSRQLYAMAGVPQTTEATLQLLMNLVHPQDRPAVARHLEQALAPSGPGRHELEFRIVRPDGETRWLRDTGRTYYEGEGESRRVIRAAGTVQDVTIRKRAALELQRLNGTLEEQIALRVRELKLAEEDQAWLAALVESSSAAFLNLQMDGTIVHWSPAAEQLFGYSAGEAVGQNVRMLMPPGRENDFDQVLVRLQRGEVVRDYETVRLHKCGDRIDVAVTVSLMKDNSGGPVGVCGIVRDIRQHKQMEQQIAELADEERQRLGRELHDSLAQQISAIGMMAASLREQLGVESLQADAVGRLEAVVEQTKEQMRSLTKGLFPVAVDAEGLRVALEELAEQTRIRHGVDCRFECPHAVPVDDNFTATQLYLVAGEAIHNAVKHGQPRRIVIRLEGRDGLRLSIRDDGPGIQGDVQEPAGMGVPIMRHRCGLIGGFLDVESPHGGGTVVTCLVTAAGGD